MVALGIIWIYLNVPTRHNREAAPLLTPLPVALVAMVSTVLADIVAAAVVASGPVEVRDLSCVVEATGLLVQCAPPSS